MIFSSFELIQQRNSETKNTSISVGGLKGHLYSFP